AHTLHALDDADHAAFVFQDRTLFDVQFEHGAEFVRAGLFAAFVADAGKLLAESLSVAVGARVGVFGGEYAGKDARGQHRRGEPRAFLVGPVHDLDWRIGLVAGLVQRPHGLKRAEHAKGAVEFPASRLGIEMRTHCDRRQITVLARPPREHVADVVDRDGAAERLALRLEPIAYLAVEVGQRQPADAAFRRAADLRRLHQ